MPKGIVTPGRNQSGGPIRPGDGNENNPYLITYSVKKLDENGEIIIVDGEPVLLPLHTPRGYKTNEISGEFKEHHAKIEIGGKYYAMIVAIEK